MADFGWTPEQEKVIMTRNRNLLVSAAAGSGKTTVLIERILQRITDEEDPVDIDRLLIVTFTTAAAQEMRTRLYKKISERLEKDPENRRLRRQLALLPNARVCTIDSFCSWLLKNYYQEIDLDPSFRVGDVGEMTLLKDDVLAALLEEKYQEGADDFIDLSESFASGKTDDSLAERILRLYEYSQSAPYPEEWLEECLKAYQIETEEQLLNSSWCVSFTAYLKTALMDCAEEAERYAQLCLRPGGPLYCYETYQGDVESLKKAAVFETYKEAREKIAGFKLETKPSRRGFDGDPALEDEANDRRGKVRERIKRLKEKTSASTAETLDIIKRLRPQAETFIRLTQAFAEAFEAEKRKKDLVDYGDLEHLAIRILKKDHQRTAVCDMLSERFAEIMVDEYQDSNYVQEEILTAVSRMARGEYNIFMVGDMKQSIYRFRMARPELFTDKYETYTKEDSDRQLIELHTNFRSGADVTETVNFFFRQLMRKEVGGITYDEDAELKIGPQKEKEEEKRQHFARETEFMIFSREDGSGNDDDEDTTGLEWEARMTAEKIYSLVREERPQIFDEAEQKFRDISFGDIVILLRSAKNTDTIFAEALEDAGIPVYVENTEGYFETWEIRLLLNLLKVIDDPIQDIPLSAVMHSPLFGFSSEELAKIALSYDAKEEGSGFYGAVLNYARDGQDLLLREKLEDFLAIIESYRADTISLTLPLLIRRLISELNLDVLAGAMPGGEQRLRNLTALISRAGAFEETSYHGIFHFIRYIERLGKSQAETGEPGNAEGAGNAVRIMTIHKSKGLEFPVVFVSGLAKLMNKQDTTNPVVLHPTLGIGMDLVDHRTRVKERSLMKQAMGERIDRENMGEELRVLYVAMTRARDKLFLTANVPSKDELVEAYQDRWTDLPGVLSESELIQARNYLTWLLSAYREEGPAELRFVEKQDLVFQREEAEVQEKMKKTALSAALFIEDEASKKRYQSAEKVFTYDYLYDDLYKLYATMSVSQLKMEKIQEIQEESMPLVYDTPEMESGEKQSVTGARRGTLYHLVMEHMDPAEADVEKALEVFVNEGLISLEEQATINRNKIRRFWKSSVGKRFIYAYLKGQGFREKQFIIGVPAGEVQDVVLKRSPDELIMIQGIIDMYFEEEDGLVLVDYKTDRVRDAEELKERYQLQLDLYERALTQITGKPVKEKLIWSFWLDREICV